MGQSRKTFKITSIYWICQTICFSHALLLYILIYYNIAKSTSKEHHENDWQLHSMAVTSSIPFIIPHSQSFGRFFNITARKHIKIAISLPQSQSFAWFFDSTGGAHGLAFAYNPPRNTKRHTNRRIDSALSNASKRNRVTVLLLFYRKGLTKC